MAEAPVPGSRRNWLLHCLQGGIAVTAAAIFYPAVRFLWPRPATSSGELEVVAPYRVNELRPDAEGKWPAPFNFGGKPCLVIRTSEGDVKAFNAICTHVECTVEYRAEAGDIFCNCHNGVYDVNGQQRIGTTAAPVGSLQGDPAGRAWKGRDRCLPRHDLKRRIDRSSSLGHAFFSTNAWGLMS